MAPSIETVVGCGTTNYTFQDEAYHQPHWRPLRDRNDTTGARPELPRQANPFHCPVCTGGPDGYTGALGGTATEYRIRPARDRGEPARCRRRAGHRIRGEERGRRLY